MTTTTTLIGYLGKDRETKTTATRTETRTFTQYNLVIDGDEEREVEITRGGRDYLLLNLASHRGTGANRSTIWHTLVVWNPDHSGVSGARLARKGDCVTVTGSPETYRYIDSNGEQRALHRRIPVHTPILVARADQCEGDCKPEHERIAKALLPAPQILWGFRANPATRSDAKAATVPT